MVAKRLQSFTRSLPKLMFLFGLIFFSVLYGMLAATNRYFPYYTLFDVGAALTLLLPENKALHWYYIRTDQSEAVPVYKPEQVVSGLTKLVTVEGDNSLAVKVIDAQGDAKQWWRIEWNDIFPEPPDYLEWSEIPKVRPGTHVHGAEIMANGDLVFNFEHLGLVRLNACGNVVWKLPFRTHHSIFIDDDGNIWVPGQLNHQQPIEKMPLYRPGFIEPFVLQVSPEGNILQQKSLFDLLIANNLEGVLYVQASDNWFPISRGDSLHLNDVEIFSESMQEGFFQAGDIMISVRNANTIAVFDRNWRLKYSLANEFVRQHDPDFVDGNRISLFDNHNVAEQDDKPTPYSRILIKSVVDDSLEVAFSGTEEQPFFSNIMGKHQWLENGNLLISESRFGRVLEVDAQGHKVWELYNIVEPGWLGIVEEAERLPVKMNARFFADARQRCEAGLKAAK